ncbi:MAG: ATP-dependent Clp protease ATP-binding subunit [Pyrinomonadaceae bacterium]
MFERYTERSRRVIFFARYEALQYGSPAILPEHILLGLLREDKAIAVRCASSKQNLSVDAVRRSVEEHMVVRDRTPQNSDLVLSAEARSVLLFASEESRTLRSQQICPEHLLLALLRAERSPVSEILHDHGLRLEDVRGELLDRRGIAEPSIYKVGERGTPALNEFARDLTKVAASGKVDPLIGREDETERLVDILCRRNKNNAVLIGESGVGKTAIVEGLAKRIVDKRVPPFLESKRLLALDLSLVVAGTKYRGQFEERLKKIITELQENDDTIIFIDELHALVGAGSAEGSLDAANILKPALSRGEIHCIGATTPAEYRKTIAKDRALERRFQVVKVEPPDEAEALRIVEGIVERYEVFHQVRYAKNALHAAVYQASRYIPDRFLPDKAIDVLDEAGSRAKLGYVRKNRADASSKKKSASLDELELIENSLTMIEVTREDVEDVIARWTGIPVASIRLEETQRLLEIENELHKRIVSQRPAISALARAIRRSRAGLKVADRPIGSFLFLGPTGVGKTEVARSLAAFLFGSERSLIRFDMSEYMERHSVAKFIGSPPGYVGHEEGGQLTERLRRSPYSIVLFDEIEKSHPDIFNVLLQVFEDGQLTDGQGITADCKNAIFIMTSNIGARALQKRGKLGFQSGAMASREKMEDQILADVRATFAPEFINRLDEIIIFDSLSDSDLEQIVDLQLSGLNELLRDRRITVSMTDDARKWLINKTCGDKAYGARPLKRALQKYVEDELSEAMLQGKIGDENNIEVFINDGNPELRVILSES